MAHNVKGAEQVSAGIQGGAPAVIRLTPDMGTCCKPCLTSKVAGAVPPALSQPTREVLDIRMDTLCTSNYMPQNDAYGT